MMSVSFLIWLIPAGFFPNLANTSSIIDNDLWLHNSRLQSSCVQALVNSSMANNSETPSDNLFKAEKLSEYMSDVFKWQIATVTHRVVPENTDFLVPGRPTAPKEIAPELIAESREIVKELVKAYLNPCRYFFYCICMLPPTWITIDELKYSIVYYVDELSRGAGEELLKEIWPPLTTKSKDEKILVENNTVVTDKDGKVIVWFLPKLFSPQRQVS